MELQKSETRVQSQILRESLEGVRQWLMNEWAARVVNPSLTVTLHNSYTQDAERTLVQNANLEAGASIPLPYAVLIPTQMSPTTERFNSFALQKLGMRTGIKDGKERREKLKPIDLGLGVRFETRDMAEALMFARIWAENSPDASFAVTQNSTGFEFQIQMVPDPSVEIPTSDQTPEANLVVQTTLIVHTFVGTSEINRLITKVERNMRDLKSKGTDSDYVLHRIESDAYTLAHPENIKAVRRGDVL